MFSLQMSFLHCCCFYLLLFRNFIFVYFLLVKSCSCPIFFSFYLINVVVCYSNCRFKCYVISQFAFVFLCRFHEVLSFLFLFLPLLFIINVQRGCYRLQGRCGFIFLSFIELLSFLGFLSFVLLFVSNEVVLVMIVVL